MTGDDMTRYGKAILEIINNSDRHMTAEEIYFSLRENVGKVAIATVYNNLNSLCEEGEIKKLSFPNEPDRYDKTIRHDHLVCSKCGKITDIFLDDISAQLNEALGMQIDSYDLKMFYVCDDCRLPDNN